MWAQHNPRVPLGVIPVISKGCFWQISNITIKFVLLVFLYLNPSSVHVVLNWYWARTFIKVTEKIKLVHEIDLVCDLVILFIAHHKSVSFKLRIYLVFFYTFKPVCRTTFETLCERLQSLLVMKLTTDVTLLYLSALDNYIFVYFYVTSMDYEINWINKYLKWISKKSSWETMFSWKYLCSEWTATQEENT